MEWRTKSLMCGFAVAAMGVGCNSRTQAQAERAAEEAGETIEMAARDVGDSVEKAAPKVKAGLEEAGQNLEEAANTAAEGTKKVTRKAVRGTQRALNEADAELEEEAVEAPPHNVAPAVSP